MEKHMNETRTEKDSMGEVQVPEDAYYSASTQRAVENFPISGNTMPNEFIYTVALIKQCAAQANCENGLLEKDMSDAIIQVCVEIVEGNFDSDFPVDVFQTGSGTSTNMNMNEVIASRANEILIGDKDGKSFVHPNDHVNLCQSSNDVIPTAIHITAMILIRHSLIPSLRTLFTRLQEKAKEFKAVEKIGRTHLQDAVPITLGQEFAGYARQVALGTKRLLNAGESLSELALGGTAVGNGLNAHPVFSEKVIDLISIKTGIDFKEAKDHFQAQSTQDVAVEASGVLKSIAVSFYKIANDIRLLGSGPRCGLNEISLPSLQPGSSIMPGKVNPVIPEAVIQAAAQVIGNDAAITVGGLGGYLELNTMLPLIAVNLVNSIKLLSSTGTVFAEKCIKGIKANPDVCSGNVEKSLAMATLLVPHVGYDRAAEIAKKAYEEGKTIKEVVTEDKVLTESQIKEVFNHNE